MNRLGLVNCCEGCCIFWHTSRDLPTLACT
eukprot:COSAG02_NODE_55106_length_292_cov_1.015544_1_plen_29_part_10